MKNKFLRFIALFSVILSLTGCGLLKKATINGNTETVMGTTQNMYQVTHEYNARQIDSMCVVDVLPRNLNDWIQRSYNDYETNEYVTRYMYIKEMNNNYEMIYIVTPRGEIYVVSKRRVVTEEE